jgi:predicted heme/steroid binding protein
LLHELQARAVRGEVATPNRWVALCGTVFDVSGDPFFDPRAGGVYALWTGHDATHLLLEMGVNMGLADDDASMTRLLDVDTPFDLVDTAGHRANEAVKEATQRQQRRDILNEWVHRFHTRYPAVAQLRDLFVGEQWDKLRAELDPSTEEGRSRPAGKCPMGFGSSSSSSSRASPHAQRQGGKCPLGFGSRSVARVASPSLDLKSRRTIVFQGTTYDVTDSPTFQEGGELAHFVGHDVTHALATQSSSVDDLDVDAPPHGYSYEQQVALEHYRVTFNREFAAVDSGASAMQAGERRGNAVSAVDLHALIEQIDSESDEALVSKMTEAIRSAILLKQVADVDAVCVRTSMTALHKAVEKNQLEIVRMLVEGGADVRAEAGLYDNETPLEMAQRFRFNEVADFLSAQARSAP